MRCSLCTDGTAIAGRRSRCWPPCGAMAFFLVAGQVGPGRLRHRVRHPDPGRQRQQRAVPVAHRPPTSCSSPRARSPVRSTTGRPEPRICVAAGATFAPAHGEQRRRSPAQPGASRPSRPRVRRKRCRSRTRAFITFTGSINNNGPATILNLPSGTIVVNASFNLGTRGERHQPGDHHRQRHREQQRRHAGGQPGDDHRDRSASPTTARSSTPATSRSAASSRSTPVAASSTSAGPTPARMINNDDRVEQGRHRDQHRSAAQRGLVHPDGRRHHQRRQLHQQQQRDRVRPVPVHRPDPHPRTRSSATRRRRRSSSTPSTSSARRPIFDTELGTVTNVVRARWSTPVAGLPAGRLRLRPHADPDANTVADPHADRRPPRRPPRRPRRPHRRRPPHRPRPRLQRRLPRRLRPPRRRRPRLPRQPRHPRRHRPRLRRRTDDHRPPPWRRHATDDGPATARRPPRRRRSRRRQRPSPPA